MAPPLRRLSIFPLPLVLFPGAPLPLHIFEPRYRQMLSDCLRDDARFGIVCAAPDDAPPVGRGEVGCVAKVETTAMLPDGRSNIIVTGESRFTIERVLDSATPYLVAEVAFFDDATDRAPDLPVLTDRIRALFTRVTGAARTLADEGGELPALPEEPGALSFAIASMIDLELPTRQRLLASRSAAERLRALEPLLTPALHRLEERAAVHERAKSNGHGLHAPPAPPSPAPE